MTVAANALAVPNPPAVPATPVDPAAVAAAMDPAQIAAHVPPLTPPPASVQIADSLFNWLESGVIALMFALIALLVARLLHAWLLHRSINKSIDAKSDAAGALIEKVNKPVELNARSDAPGDDRNGLVLVAIGLAMAGFGVIQGDEQTIRLAAGASLFPLLVGAALIIRRQILKREQEKGSAADRA